MPNGFFVLNEKDWANMTPLQREWAIFNTMQSMHNRLLSLEKKGWISKACATMGGIVGGIAAVVGFKLAG
jgi:hypothetical protein